MFRRSLLFLFEPSLDINHFCLKKIGTELTNASRINVCTGNTIKRVICIILSINNFLWNFWMTLKPHRKIIYQSVIVIIYYRFTVCRKIRLVTLSTTLRALSFLHLLWNADVQVARKTLVGPKYVVNFYRTFIEKDHRNFVVNPTDSFIRCRAFTPELVCRYAFKIDSWNAVL